MKRGTRNFVLGLVAIAALVPLSWLLLREEPSPRTTTPQAPVQASVDAGLALPQLSINKVVGRVEVRRGDGGWVEAREGERVAANDGVRTQDSSTADLVGGQFWEVRLEPGTEVGVGELSASITKLLLENGMAHATVHGGGRHTFEVRAAHSDAFASADGGTFTMATNGQGTVAVGTASGDVLFSSSGRVVIVRAGQQSVSTPGQPPSAPAPIPSTLLLKVALPPRNLVNTPKVTVRGSAEPGALVTVDGHVVSADERGRFTTTIKLKEGVNQVRVQARGVGEGTNESVHRIELDTKVSAPVIDRNLWR